MLSGIIEGGAALVIAIAGGIYIIGQMRENARKNEVDIKAIKEMMLTFQDNMTELLTKSMNDVKQLIELNKQHQKESVEKEIAHLKDLISLTNNETRADIQRLQNEQRESNNLKAKILLMQASLKSLHKRLDIDPPTIIEDEN